MQKLTILIIILHGHFLQAVTYESLPVHKFTYTYVLTLYSLHMWEREKLY